MFKERRAELTLAAMTLAAIGMMIVPLPTGLIDLLLASNMALAAVLLLVSLTIRDITALSSLPSLLLLTTLLRLALNVSTTRLILLDADAGQVISAFGNFVVQGSLVVGAVIFLILTIVQFVVIARGAERVAEVAARFSLDAMPGRQMAIDADLRAGAINAQEAHDQRRGLQRESQLYGALDGALKFVKGDAIAGVIITTINILGGLAIGLGQRGLPLEEAARVYLLLTIGDGLVSQLPALLTATAAGIAVTRVTSSGERLGAEIAAQLFSQPRPLAVAATLCALLALTPGLPWLPFLALSAALTARSIWLTRRPSTGGDDAEIASSSLWGSDAALSLRASPALLDALEAPDTRTTLNDAWRQRASAIWRQRGVPLPALTLETLTNDDDAAPDDEPWRYVVAVRAVPAGRGSMTAGSVDIDRLVESAAAAAEAHLTSLLGMQEVHDALEALRKTAPAEVEALVPKVLALPALTEVLRSLVAEGVSIRPLRDILGALASQAPQKPHHDAMVNAARAALQRSISHSLSPTGGPLAVYTVEPEIEAMLRDALRHDERRLRLALPPALRRDIQSAAQRVLPEEGAVVLTAPEIRSSLKGLLATACPKVRVFAYTELVPELVLAPQGEVRVTRQG